MRFFNLFRNALKVIESGGHDILYFYLVKFCQSVIAFTVSVQKEVIDCTPEEKNP